jgi:hypothetical protein
MFFFQRPFRRSASLRVGPAALAVGRRVYVTSSGGGRARVALTDDGSTIAVATLADGTEVEILAWRPLGSVGTRYRVRSTGDGCEGWLAAVNLRSSRLRAPKPATAGLPATVAAPRLARNGRASRRRRVGPRAS